MKILLLGGTGFIGPHQLPYALARDHHVTVFNRGLTSRELPQGVEWLAGDREMGDYASLVGREFDVCIDNACSVPRWVRDAADVLAGHVRHYVFISTISVYADGSVPGQDESAAREQFHGPDAMAVTLADLRATPALYGSLKTRCEDEAHARYAGMATIIRPGLIVGPGDATDRFTYWPVRIARGGQVLAPPLADPIQIIDVRDLAEWTIRVAETHATGDFNAVGPAGVLTMGALLDASIKAASSDARIRSASAAFLSGQGVRPWQDLPVWIPGDGDTCGFHRRSNRRAVDAGLTFRPIAATVADTLTWWRQLSDTRQKSLKIGLTAEREATLLTLLDENA